MTWKRAISTQHAPRPFGGGQYSQAVVCGDFIFVSGQIAIDPASGTVVEGGIVGQTEQALSNVAAILEAGGSNMGLILKAIVYLADFAEFAEMNDVYSRRVEGDPPARTTIEVARLPSDVRVEIDVIASIGTQSGGLPGG